MANIVFWQRIVSPHMAGLATEMAQLGHNVTYIAETLMSEQRADMGWTAPEVSPANLILRKDRDSLVSLARAMPSDTLHICQGLRANGHVGKVQRELSLLRHRQWAIMETVDDCGYSGILKRLVYAHLCQRFMTYGEGILAIGRSTPTWLVERGLVRSKVFPFAYFLPNRSSVITAKEPSRKSFQIIFVGSLIGRKRVRDLIAALALLGPDMPPWELVILGDGPERGELERISDLRIPGHVRWLGSRPLHGVADVLSRADLLVLPSEHDGWGAVVSEALIAGTPAVCSDRCGAASVVSESGVGGVYSMGCIPDLTLHIRDALALGKITLAKREEIAEWAKSLTAKQGAVYLERILGLNSGGVNSAPPWVKER